VYLAIVFLGQNPSSQIYVQSKAKYGAEIGIACKIFGQEKEEFSEPEVIEKIKTLNEDQDCVGIIVQLPLPASLEEAKYRICAAVHPLKDLDGLGGIVNGWKQLGVIGFLPATAQAVLSLREHYALGSMKGLKIAVLGQSNVVGKPLAIECVRQGAEVCVFTDQDNKEAIMQYTQ